MTQDYVSVTITKYHTAGLLKGMTTTEEEKWVEWNDCIARAKEINRSPMWDWNITEIKDNNSDKVWLR